MIVTCQQCHKRYLIEKEDIGPEGRQVRCVACGYSWQQPQLDEPLNLGVTLKSSTFDPGYVKTIKKSKKSSWLLILMSCIFVLCAVYIARDPIIAEWPIMGKVFSALKLPLDRYYEGLVIENVVLIQDKHASHNTYVLKGEIVNKTDEIKALPVLEISVHGDCKYAGKISKLHHTLRALKAKIFKSSTKNDSLCVLDVWEYPLSERRLFPSEKFQFETPVHLIVQGATDISVEF